MNVTPFSAEDKRRMMEPYDETTPNGLIQKYYQYASFIFAWRGNEGAKTKVEHYREELDLYGNQTGQIEYNPIFTKNNQGGEKKISTSRWIDNTGEIHTTAARLWREIMSRRPEDAKDSRFFLTPNQNWQRSGKWYTRQPIGKESMRTWTKEAAKAIGMNIT